VALHTGYSPRRRRADPAATITNGAWSAGNTPIGWSPDTSDQNVEVNNTTATVGPFTTPGATFAARSGMTLTIPRQ
jgi:hypothetical protein